MGVTRSRMARHIGAKSTTRPWCGGFCLGILYGLKARSLANRTGISRDEAREILARLKARFRVFEEFADRVADRAGLDLELSTPFDWRMRCPPGTNPRTVRNFPIQSSGSEILHAACNPCGTAQGPPGSERPRRADGRRTGRYDRGNIGRARPGHARRISDRAQRLRVGHRLSSKFFTTRSFLKRHVRTYHVFECLCRLFMSSSSSPAFLATSLPPTKKAAK
jgi:DNA polymerase family A